MLEQGQAPVLAQLLAQAQVPERALVLERVLAQGLEQAQASAL